MKKFILSIVFLVLLAIQNDVLANELLIPISVIPGSGLSSNLLSQKNIISITKEALEKNNVNISKNGPFLMAKIRLVNRYNDNYILVFLPKKNIFKFEAVKISLDETDHPTSVKTHYKLTSKDLHNQYSPQTNEQQCPDPSVTFVVASPFYKDLSNVRNTTDKEYSTAKKQGYVPYKLVDDQATINNYFNWLSCPNLKAFAHIGHGNSSNILLSDGILNVDTIKKNVHLNERTILSFDSCEVFNDPMKSTMINDVQAQRFSGGISELMMFGSVETYGCAFDHMLDYGTPMTRSLEICKIKYDPTVKDSRSPVYVINDTENDDNPAYPVYILTKNSTKPIELDSLGDDAQIDLSKENFLKEIYIMMPTGKLDCNQFSKKHGLRAEEYDVTLTDNTPKTCQISDEKTGWNDQYGIGGNGSDYLLR